MKTLALLLLLPMLAWKAPLVGSLDKKNGLGIYTFGNNPDSYHNLMLEIREGNTVLYSVEDDNIHMNGVQFDYVRLTFVKNKLGAIAIGTRNGGGLKAYEYLVENFGKPVQINKNFEWNGDKVSLTLEKTADKKDAVIYMYSKEVYGSSPVKK